MKRLLGGKYVLPLLCAAAALICLLLSALTGSLPLLWALLSLVALVPLKDKIRGGIAVWLAVSLLALLIPGGGYSAQIFALFGYYPLVRDRIAGMGSRALRSGIRFGIIVLTGAALYYGTVLLYGDSLPIEAAEDRGLLLAVALLSTAIYFLLFDFIIKKASQVYDDALGRAQ